MKAQDIKVGHIYYVDFEPTRKGEFDKYHLALVLKKTVNEITFIVIPLTSKAEGLELNKIKLDIKELLPTNLKEKDTYAVYDQIRTVNASRFRPLLENSEPFDVIVPDNIVDNVFEAIISNLLFGLDEKRKEEILKSFK